MSDSKKKTETSMTPAADADREELRRAPREILRWIEEQLSRKCTMIVLRQVTGNAEQAVRSWDVTPETDAEDLACAVDVRVEDDGRKLRGPTTFVLYAYVAAGREHIDRKILRVEGGAFAHGVETEPANVLGITAQLMRHNEMSVKVCLGQTAFLFDTLDKELNRYRARVTELEDNARDVEAMRRAMIEDEHRRSLEKERQASEIKVREEMVGGFMRQVPTLLEQIFRRPGDAPRAALAAAGPRKVDAKAPPTDDDASHASLIRNFSALVNSLTQEQTNKIGSVLTEEQFALLQKVVIGEAMRAERERSTADADASREEAEKAAE